MGIEQNSQKNSKETLKSRATSLEMEALGLKSETERRLGSERDPEARRSLDIRLQELRNILASLMAPTEEYLAKAQERLQTLRKDPLSVGGHEFLRIPQSEGVPESAPPAISPEIEVASLLRETEQRLGQEKDLWTRELLFDRRQVLEGILASLAVSKGRRTERIRTQLQMLREYPIETNAFGHAISEQNHDHPGNGAEA